MIKPAIKEIWKLIIIIIIIIIITIIIIIIIVIIIKYFKFIYAVSINKHYTDAVL